MNNIKKYIGFGLSVAFLWSCTYDEPAQMEPTSGSADFTKLVSVGNSLTAGYMDGALYTAAQMHSFPALLAMQMDIVGGNGEFNQPDINSVNGYNSAVSNPPDVILGRFILAQQGATGSPGPTPTGPLSGLPAPYNTADLPSAYTGNKASLNNFGVPGVTLGTALIPQTGTPGDGLENGLYTRFASSPGTSTIIGDAAAALADGGTFFTFWLGNNDVLGFAVGGANEEGSAPLTSEADFETRFTQALGAMLAANAEAKGVVANIPDVTSIPYFKLVPWNAINIDAATAGQLNAGYAEYNGGLQAAYGAQIIGQEEYERRIINFVEGTNGFVIEDPELTDINAMSGGAIPLPNLRQSESTDLVPLSMGSRLPTGVGTSTPAGDEGVVTPAELAIIQNSTNSFNAIIADAVTANNNRLALIDINQILKNLVTNGASINSSSLNASISPPFGAFSTDGVHPNQRGYAYLANQFIDVINKKFNSTIPKLNPNDYPGNSLPLVLQ